MIQPLRRAHRVVIPMLLLVLLGALVITMVRPPASTLMMRLPPELAPQKTTR